MQGTQLGKQLYRVCRGRQFQQQILTQNSNVQKLEVIFVGVLSVRKIRHRDCETNLFAESSACSVQYLDSDKQPIHQRINAIRERWQAVPSRE